MKIHKLSDLPPDIHKQFSYLCQLAYYELKLQSWSFPGRKLSHHFPFASKYTDGLNLTSSSVSEDSGPEFLHRTLMEYLAAVHVSVTIREGVSQYVAELSQMVSKGLCGYFPFFIAGLTKGCFLTKEMLCVIEENIIYIIIYMCYFLRLTIHFL